MLPTSPRRCIPAVTWVSTLAVLLAAQLCGTASAQTLAGHVFASEFDELPDADPRWTRLGDAGAAVLEGPEGPELLVNDNSPGDCIAYQALLGEIQKDHRASVTARVRVLQNLGAHSVMIEVSRPGLEMIVRLDVDHIDVHERRGGRETVWLGRADADLSVYRDVSVTKLGFAEDPRESVVVEIDGSEVLRVAGRGDGSLGVGRIVFGSLDYPNLGASVWRTMAVSVVPVTVDEGLDADAPSLGAFKARYLR